MSGVKCQVSHFFLPVFLGKSDGASWWRVCYQWGLPHLVFVVVFVVKLGGLLIAPAKGFDLKLRPIFALWSDLAFGMSKYSKYDD